MDTPKMRPIPDEERLLVLALLHACYSGNDAEKLPPGSEPEPRPTVRAAKVLAMRTAS
jgi:hypothetical protein